jgi:tetratricopeptide (TPR) repeat protein
MMRAMAAALLFAMSAPNAASAQVASTQVLRQQLELWAERCANVERQLSLETVERACTSIIRSDNATSPVRAFAYRQRGLVFLERGDRTRAMEDFGGAIQYNPHFTMAYISRAALYEAQGEYEHAVADYDEVIRTAPEFGPAYAARCWLRTLAGTNLLMARADCDRAIDMGAGYSARDSRGLLNLREGNAEAAWADYNAAVSADRSGHALYGRGVSALRLGRAEAGQADIAAATALDPGIAATYAAYGVAP